MKESETTPVMYDKRIDQIGYVGELVKLHTDDLKTAVKSRMLGGEVKIASGLKFDASISQYRTSEIPAEKVWNLWKKKKITQSQLLSMLKVSSSNAKQVFSGAEIEAMSVPGEVVTKLNVSRKKGFELSLVDALKSIDLETKVSE